MSESYTILVVDRDAVVRKRLRSALEGMGHQVLDAHDAAAGHAALERGQPDLVVADLALNGAGGESFIGTLRQRSPGLPVIAAAEANAAAGLREALEAGAWDCVSREPVHPDELAAALMRVRARSLLSSEHQEYQRLLEDLVAERTARLEEGMRRITSLLANLPGTVFRCRNDRLWTMEYLSPGVAALTGYAAWQLIENAEAAFGDLILPEDRERAWREVQAALDRKGPYQIAYRIRRADGDISWVWEQGRGDYREDGSLAAIEGYISDITAQRTAESTAQLDEDLLLSLHSLSRMSLVASQEAVASFVLEEGVRQTGSDLGLLLVHDEPMDALRPYLRCEGGVCRNSGPDAPLLPVTASGVWSEALRMRRPVLENDCREAPEERTCPGLSAPVRRLLVVPVVEGGQVIALTGVANKQLPYEDGDMRQLSLLCGELGRVIAAKRSSEHIRKLSRAVDQGPNSVIIADTRNRIEYVNRRFESLTGIPAAEAVGRDLQELVLGSLGPEERDAFRAAVGEGREWHGEISRSVGESGERWMTASCTVLRDDAGGTTHLVLILEDVTERKRLETVLQGYSEHLEWMVAERTREADEARRFAEAANKAKSEFLSMMSHELRSPLNVIIGFSELMLAGMTGELTGAQQQNLKDIQNSGNRLLNLIDNILDLTRIETSSLMLERSPFVLKDVIAAAAALVREKAAKHAITVSLDVSEDVGTVTADERKMKQVMAHLIGNAVKFSPDGGAVQVTARRDSASGGATELISISVRDSGVGIAPEDRERIFEPFHQADASYTKRFEGAGIGLSLSKRLVELHGGTVRVESEPGRGSTFTVVIPDMRQEGTP